ncbi:MAG TPA: SH3 domain-containing protein [Thermoanaerobaculaceae bacterium]|nr:SH3 domain-containing protein [Thermoanaerobaculaceae bacterium]HRS16959.1 SH3 domain-containing protein [Thermoanaerobaculaceae bacterium]
MSLRDARSWTLAAVLAGVVLGQACATVQPPAPPPEPPPAPVEVVRLPEPAPPPPVYVRVSGTTLNVREGAGTSFKVVGKAARGERLLVLGEEGDWLEVRLTPERTGWVHGKYVRREEPCPPDKNTAEILDEPDVVLRPDGPRVVLEATVNARGEVTAVKLVENTTGDDALRWRAEAELRALRFSPPVRNCKPRPFIYTFTRTF